MVIASFVISVGVVVLVLLALAVINRATHDRRRRAMARELDGFLRDAAAPDPDHGTGTWRGMPVRVAINHYSIDFEIDLPHAVIPYPALLARYGGDDLAARLSRLELHLDEHDRLIGRVPRENGLAESIVTVETRIAMADEVRALRAFAPRELMLAVASARSSREVDELLVSMTAFHPDAAETTQAIEQAAQREHGDGERVRERAHGWLAGAHGAPTPHMVSDAGMVSP